jgi:hypothetical protein
MISFFCGGVGPGNVPPDSQANAEHYIHSDWEYNLCFVEALCTDRE